MIDAVFRKIVEFCSPSAVFIRSLFFLRGSGELHHHTVRADAVLIIRIIIFYLDRDINGRRFLFLSAHFCIKEGVCAFFIVILLLERVILHRILRYIILDERAVPIAVKIVKGKCPRLRNLYLSDLLTVCQQSDRDGLRPVS